MSGSTTKNLTYKLCQFQGDVSRDLQSLLKSACKKRGLAKERAVSVDGVESHRRLINFHAVRQGMFVGVLMDFTEGQSIASAQRDPAASTWEVTGIKPSAGKEFVDDRECFAVFKNHVVVAQSRSLRSNQLASYLNQFLRDCELLKDDQFLRLTDCPTEEIAKEVTGAKTLSIGKPLPFEEGESGEITTRPQAVSHSETGSNAKSLKYRLSSIAVKTLRALLPDSVKLPDQMSIDELAANRELMVRVELQWQRPRENDSTALLDTISSQFSDIEDAGLDWQVKTKSGDIISAKDVKLKLPISVKVREDGLLAIDDIWPKAKTWLEELLENHRIPDKS